MRFFSTWLLLFIPKVLWFRSIFHAYHFQETTHVFTTHEYWVAIKLYYSYLNTVWKCHQISSAVALPWQHSYHNIKPGHSHKGYWPCHLATLMYWVMWPSDTFVRITQLYVYLLVLCNHNFYFRAFYWLTNIHPGRLSSLTNQCLMHMIVCMEILN